MAGPAASVLLPDVLTADGTARLRRWLEGSFRSEGGDWWTPIAAAGAGMLLVEPEGYESDDFAEAESLIGAIGYLPATEIVLAASVNRPESHRLLGETALELAVFFDGFVDFDGLLPPAARTLPGRCFLVTATEDPDGPGWHVGDPEFLRAWLRHPGFRMVK
ncbi:DUF6368 family protein [Actinoplanes sp. NPDC023714]|uniref:DUF6368 family protein n=1 Tax=Actinoplanes sp. NPDC023714 TaxID=3154322 RepID=UPI0033C6E907